jgi:hypothetical protein
MNMRNRLGRWVIINAFFVWLLYASFIQHSTGAQSLLTFIVWFMLVISMFTLNERIATELRKKKPPQWFLVLDMAFDCLVSGALAWYGHPGLAAAY